MNEELMKKVRKEFGNGNQAVLEKKIMAAILLQHYVCPETKVQVGLYQSNDIYFVTALKPDNKGIMDFADSKHEGIMAFAEIVYRFWAEKKQKN
jgi:hypothetical protein